MNKLQAENLAELANLRLTPLDVESALKFLGKFAIGYEGVAFPGLSFPGVRFPSKEKEKGGNFVFFHSEDIEKARKFSESLIGSINVEESMRSGKQKFITSKDLEGLSFRWIYDQECASELCNILSRLSEEAGAFLRTIINVTSQQDYVLDVTKLDNAHYKIQQYMLEFLNKKLHNFLVNNNSCMHIVEDFTGIKSGDFKSPEIKFAPFLNIYSTINDEINAKFYISPFLSGANGIWVKARICSECGKFFFFKQERAKYCSQKCRMNVANRERRGK